MSLCGALQAEYHFRTPGYLDVLPPTPTPKQGPNKAELKAIRSFLRPPFGVGCVQAEVVLGSIKPYANPKPDLPYTNPLRPFKRTPVSLLGAHME